MARIVSLFGGYELRELRVARDQLVGRGEFVVGEEIAAVPLDESNGAVEHVSLLPPRTRSTARCAFSIDLGATPPPTLVSFNCEWMSLTVMVRAVVMFGIFVPVPVLHIACTYECVGCADGPPWYTSITFGHTM